MTSSVYSTHYFRQFPSYWSIQFIDQRPNYHLLTFLDHLLMQCRPLFQSSSIFDIVPCLQSVVISSCLPLCFHSISFSLDLCSFSQKLLVAAISHRYGWVLASSSGQTTLGFVFQESFNRFYVCSFLMSSFLMWPNLVFPLPISTSSFQQNLVVLIFLLYGQHYVQEKKN